MQLRGKYRALIEDNADDAARALTAIAHLHHQQRFDPVPLDRLGVERTSYEVRWSDSCELCGTIWIGTKAGEVLCLALAADTPDFWKVELDRGVRTLLHLHGPNAFGQDHVLLVGTDDGFLWRIHEDHSKPIRSRAALSPARIHVESWGRETPPHAALPTDSIERAKNDERYTLGITAMALLRKRDRGESPILIATRSGAIFLLETARGRIHLRRLHDMSGWVQWMIEFPEQEHVTCVSRGGELIRVSTRTPTDEVKTEKIPLLPIAAVPFLDGLMLGTTDGLVYWSERDEGHRVASVPVTRSPVLCLDRMTIPGEDDSKRPTTRDYVIMGLENGRLRVVRTELLRDLATGRPAPPEARGFSIDLGSSILAVEVLKPKGGDLARCYILATLRDHTIRMFHVQSVENDWKLIEKHWNTLVVESGAKDTKATVEALLTSASSPSDLDALRYFVLEVVPHRLCDGNQACHDWMREQVPQFLQQASPALLRMVALDVGVLAGRDPRALLEISLALFQVLPRKHPEWRKLAEQHLKALYDAARTLDKDEATRVLAWTRFVRKYVLLGDTFAQKDFSLRALMRSNYRTHKYLDALIYQALLYQRRHDLAWRVEVEGDVHSLHSTRALVVVATHAGRLWFMTHDGQRLSIHGDGGASAAASVGVEGVRTLAVIALERRGGARVVVSWTAPDAAAPSAPALSVFDVDVAGRHVTVARSEVQIKRPGGSAPSGPAASVYSLCALPRTAEVLLAGFDDRAYHFGIVQEIEGTWWLTPIGREGARSRPIEPSSLASGNVPSRAIAASSLDPQGIKFLAAIGSDDGEVSFVWFDIAHAVSRLDNALFRGPVNVIELSRDERAANPGVRDCYVGTSTGETFAGSVSVDGGVVDPVWRETYGSSVIAARLWSTPLYQDPRGGVRRILVTAAEKGRVCFHETRQSSGSSHVVSELNNYSFRGLRLDQITLPSVLTSLLVLEGTQDFIAAGPGGKVFKGSFCCTRESSERVEGDERQEGGLPINMWRSFEEIRRQMIRYDHLCFPGDPDPRRREEELLSLVHLKGGALRRYVLRYRLMGHATSCSEEEARTRWGTDAESVKGRARSLLSGLRPDVREDRELIKVVLKSLARAFLDRPIEQLRAAIEQACSAEDLSASLQPQHDAARAAVEVMTKHVLEAALQPTSFAGKLRSTAFKELFRIEVLRHAAIEEGDHRPIRAALVTALNSCLRDDETVVRVEALRAVGVTLRNIGVLHGQLSKDGGARLMEHLFRGDVGEIQWLLEPLADNLRRYTDFAPGTTHATAWYYLSAIVPMFVLFPESTLRICDRLTRAGVSMAALEVISRRLPGAIGERVRRLITRLYLVPCLREDAPRKQFLNDYRKTTLETWLKQEKWAFADVPALGEPPAEARIAKRLLVVYDTLAGFWEVEHPDRLGAVRLSLGFEKPVSSEISTAPVERRARSPMGLAEDVCARLLDLAQRIKPRAVPPMAGDNARATAITALRGEIDGSAYEGLLDPVRRITYKILDQWQSFYGGQVPGEGSKVAGYTLGPCIGEGGYGRVHVADAGVGSSPSRVAVKVFRHIYDPDGEKKEQFLKGAWANMALSGPQGARGLVRVLSVHSDPHPVYLMQMCDHNLEKHAAKLAYLEIDERFERAVVAAGEMGAGLARAHQQHIIHGDIKASNILVRHEGRTLHFELADFDMAYWDSGGLSGSAHPAEAPISIRRNEHRWRDAFALAVVLYQTFLRQPLPPLSQVPTEEELLAASEHLGRMRPREPDQRALVAALQSMFDGKCLDSTTFLKALCASSPSLVMANRRLSLDDLHLLCNTALRANLMRKSLFLSMPDGIFSQFDNGCPLKDQLLDDLGKINRDDWPDNQQHPMETWLKNAAFLTEHTVYHAIFKDALDRFRTN